MGLLSSDHPILPPNVGRGFGAEIVMDLVISRYPSSPSLPHPLDVTPPFGVEIVMGFVIS